MLKFGDIDIEQKPRKRVKLDVTALQQYNQFGGDLIEEKQGKKSTQQDRPEKVNIHEEIQIYGKILTELKKNPRGCRKIQQQSQQSQQTKDVSKLTSIKTEVKEEKPMTEDKKAKSKNSKSADKEKVVVSSNWKEFLSKQAQGKSIKKGGFGFVGIDCEFVKSDDTECLARVSLVNELNEQIFDSYVKPDKKVTDFVTHVSGITFSHIKNAPPQHKVLAEIKKLLINKIVVGHTTQKDIEICGLKNWGGFKSIIDIADAQVYSPGGKRVSLKKLALLHLGKTIQEGWHSSVEDANIAMQLFIKNKDSILKEKKIIKS